MLTFIVLACHMNVSVPDEDSPNCKKFKEPIVPEMQVSGQQELSPMACMMQSPVMIMKFSENHPGWLPRRWTCKYLQEEADI